MSDENKQTTEEAAAANAELAVAAETATESDRTTESARSSSGVARFGLFVGLLSLLLVLGAAGAVGWYLWQEHQARLTGKERIAAIESELGTKVSRQEFTQAGRQPQQEIAALRQAQAQMRTTIGEQAQRIGQLADLINRNQRGWTLAESLYLLRMADYRLRLAQDRNSAVAALEAADQALMRLADIDLLPVREAVAEEIAGLKRLPKPDPEGVALALAELQKGINRLPVKGATPETAGQAEPEQPEGDVWSVLQRFVVVKKNNRQVGGKPEPAAFATARRRLHTALELARLAAVRLDLQIFDDSLRRARTLIEEEFEAGSDAGQSFIQSLARQSERLHVGGEAEIGKARRLLEDFVATEPNALEGNG